MNLFSNYGKIVFLFAVIGLLFAVFGCDQIKYSPSGVGNVGPQQAPDIRQIAISDSTLESDTLYVSGTIIFNYNFTSTYPIIKTRVFWNGEFLSESKSGRGWFNFFTDRYEKGLGFLEFIFSLKSQSGSLASYLDREIIQVVKRIPVYIEPNYPPPVKITSMKLEEGTLRIRWEKYPYPNFDYYKIYVNSKLCTKITDPNITFYDYKNYIGGNKVVRASVIISAKGLTNQSHAAYRHPYVPILEKVEVNAFNQPVFKWKACPFYQNLKFYRIMLRYLNEPNKFYQLAQKSVATDTTFTDISPKFGDIASYSIRVVSQALKTILFSNAQTNYLGTQIPHFARIHYIPQTNSVYLNPSDFNDIQSKGKIYRLNAQTMKTEAVFSMEECTFAISEDGKELFAHAPRSSLQNRTIFKLNPLDLSVESTIPLDSTLLHADESPTEESIVFIAPHALLFKVTNGKTERLVKYDYVSGTTVSKSFPYKDDGVHIVARSYLGKYLLIRYENTYTIYDVSGETFVSKATVTDPDYFCFGPTADMYLTTQYPNIVIRNCDTDEIVKEVSIDHSLKYPSVDYTSGYLGGTVFVRSNTYYYRLYNLETQAKIFEIGTVELKKYEAFNNMIFSRLGLYLRVNY